MALTADYLTVLVSVDRISVWMMSSMLHQVSFMKLMLCVTVILQGVSSVEEHEVSDSVTAGLQQ